VGWYETFIPVESAYLHKAQQHSSLKLPFNLCDFWVQCKESEWWLPFCLNENGRMVELFLYEKKKNHDRYLSSFSILSLKAKIEINYDQLWNQNGQFLCFMEFYSINDLSVYTCTHALLLTAHFTSIMCILLLYYSTRKKLLVNIIQQPQQHKWRQWERKFVEEEEHVI